MKQNKRGFTMAEMLITIGIIAVLMAFASIPIAGYMRSLHQVEMDGIAKEIFVAAQNHLTMADSQNLTAGKLPGTQEGTSDVYYFVVGVGADGSYPGGTSKVLDYMLPVASIDDTVRLGGSYVIRYQPSQARILDVFYASNTGRFNHDFTDDAYDAIKALAGEDQKSARRNCLGGAVIGWYGGEEALNLLEKGTKLQPPTVEVINAERLLVRVSYKHDPLETEIEKGTLPAALPADAKIKLTLTVTGETSGQYKVFHLISNGDVLATKQQMAGDNNTFEIVLDDVTKVTNENLLWDKDKDDDTKKQKSNHFADVFYEADTDPKLIPGENITVQAKLTNNNVLTNVASSSTVRTNSLFADLKEIDGKPTAVISNIRHLENLDTDISALNKAALGSLANAKQTAELDWDQFMASILGVTAGYSGDYDAVYGTESHQVNYGTESKPDLKKGVQICTYAAPSETAKESATNCFMPVNMTGMTYDGRYFDGEGSSANHTIANIRTNVTDGPAGVFGTLDECTLENVTVYNSVSQKEEMLAIKGSGATGGLVGAMNGGEVKYCSAAVYVESTGAAAGGLIGAAGNVNVNHSYTGGHTTDGKYLPTSDLGTEDKHTHWNVQGTTAGGLIGTVSGGKVEDCYSTASVYGSTMGGGFAGSITASLLEGKTVINRNYATGLVYAGPEATPVPAGAFAGYLNDLGILGDNGSEETTDDDNLNYYYEAVNYDGSKNLSMPGIPEEADDTEADKTAKKNAVGRIDADKTTIDKFYPRIYTGTQAYLNVDAKPYDDMLLDYYNELYPLLDVTGIGTHYGDWPMMETFVINKE